MAQARKPKTEARIPAGLDACISRNELLSLLAEDEEPISNTVISDLELSEINAHEATFDTVVFRDCTFDTAIFSGCTLRDVRFINCRFIRCFFDRAWLSRVDFIDCSAPGISLLQTRLAHVTARNTDFSYANLSETSIDQLRLSSCRLVEAAMQLAKIKRISLEGCDLTRLDVYRTPLTGIDLSDCTFVAPTLSQDYHELRGAIVSPDQALDLSRLLGIRIADD